MGTAYVDSDGNVVSLDGRGGPKVAVTEADVQDPQKLARLLEQALRDISDLRRKYDPNRIYFRDRAVDATGTTQYKFEHGFGGRVNWYVCQWDPTVAGTEVRLDQYSSTDENTLVLVSGGAGTVTILVEEAG